MVDVDFSPRTPLRLLNRNPETARSSSLLSVVEGMACLVRLDPGPIKGYAEARPGRDRHVTVLVHRVKLIRVAAGVDRRLRHLQLRMDQPQLVIIRVADGRHRVSMV